jgi:hypothetical protein
MTRPMFKCIDCGFMDCICTAEDYYRLEEDDRLKLQAAVQQSQEADNEIRSLGRKYEDGQHLLQWEDEARYDTQGRL